MSDAAAAGNASSQHGDPRSPGGLARSTLQAVDILTRLVIRPIIIENGRMGQDEWRWSRRRTRSSSCPRPASVTTYRHQGPHLEIADIHASANATSRGIGNGVGASGMMALARRRRFETGAACLPGQLPFRAGTRPRIEEHHREHWAHLNGSGNWRPSAQHLQDAAFSERPGTCFSRNFSGSQRRFRAACVGPWRTGGSIRPSPRALCWVGGRLIGRRETVLGAAIEDIPARQTEWEEALCRRSRKAAGEKPVFETECGIPLKRVYTAADIADIPASELGFPGAYPFHAGRLIRPSYRGRPWTIRQVRRLRQPRGDQPALQIHDPDGSDRPFDRFRPSDVAGARFRRPHGLRRGRGESASPSTRWTTSTACSTHRPREDLGLPHHKSLSLGHLRHVRHGGGTAWLRPA